MTAVREMTPPPLEAGADLAGLGAFPWPQVNLLPPEIRSRRTLGRVKLRLGLALLLVLLLAALAFVAAMFDERNAQEELQTQQLEVQRLTEEQAKYAEVPLIKGQIAQAEAARAYGMSTEVIWVDLLRAIQAVTPPGVSIESLTITAPSPILASVAPTDPLATGSIGSITFVGSSPTLPDVAAWLDGLDSVPGFSNAAFSTAEISDDEGVVSYETTSTVQFDESIFSHRFDLKESDS